jgi:hypothetical protein
MTYKTIERETKNLGEFGHSTQKEFDEAITALPGLIKAGRDGDENAGRFANDLLWALANESVNTRKCVDLNMVFSFGNREG